MMQLKPDQARFSALLKETITLMCKNGLTFDSKFSIDCIIGVTLDEKEAFYISINDMAGKMPGSDVESGASEAQPTNEYPRKKCRRSSSRGKSGGAGNRGNRTAASKDGLTLPRKRGLSDAESEDNAIMFIKEEPKTTWDQNHTQNHTQDHTQDQTQNHTQNQTDSQLHADEEVQFPDVSQDSSLGDGIYEPVVHQPGGSQHPVHSPAGHPSGGSHQSQTQIPYFRRYMYSGVAGCHGNSSEQRAPDDISQFMITGRSSPKVKTIRHCDICNKDFTSQYGFQVHQKRHAGIHPYSCEVCGKGMSSKTNYDEHMRHHTGITLNCHKCNRAFITYRAYKTHVLACK